MTVAAGPTVLADVPKELFIGGAWRPAASGARLSVENPATGAPLCEVAAADVSDAIAALDAAADAQASWAATAPRVRGEILRRAYELIVARADELAVLMTMEMGKPLSESHGEIAYAAEFFRWFSEEAVRIGGRFGLAPDGGTRVVTTRQPVGPCLLITPWNFPLAMGTRKIGPAIAAGCTMVVKPAKQTPLSMLALATILVEAGLPDGVLNVVVAESAGATMGPLIADPRIRKLSFTGSTEVGRRLVAQSAQHLQRVSMELGGNAPFLVLADADVDAAVEGALLAKMRNGGEACTAANRFYVAASRHEEFATRFAERMADLRVGNGLEPGVQVGPLIDEAQRAKVTELVEDGRERGATVLAGGDPLDGPGYFFAPTVLADVPDDAAILGEETFGPVAPIVAFADDDEEGAIRAANATEYGLVAYIYTRDVGRGLRVAEALDTGMVGINRGVVSSAAAPFGGVKASGFGREGGAEGIDEYLETKYIAVDR
ncbi:Succinate-semialdehyde dehydrogenase [Baekduia alba]|uniref:NAD-dependent succinate-semialdehyde dehydrogenase n=1 Tax=Baekduia alba TaxID=2997333 RepID=UPI00233FC607|nr:NAD-dependent succinate-semialdehyde dehydrogenase [Baekduia alba]WCB91737.1 Succinate-semialdehyde dehydrogenase [Baekduia alba]